MSGWHVLAVGGELDLYTAPTLRERIAEEDAGSSVALDVTGVSFIDSSGLGAMVASLKHVKESGGRLAIVTPDGSPVERLLALTGLDQVLQVGRTLDDLATLA